MVDLADFLIPCFVVDLRQRARSLVKDQSVDSRIDLSLVGVIFGFDAHFLDNLSLEQVHTLLVYVKLDHPSMKGLFVFYRVEFFTMHPPHVPNIREPVLHYAKFLLFCRCSDRRAAVVADDQYMLYFQVVDRIGES